MGVHFPMLKKHCSTCGKTCWHNALPGKKDEAAGYRCTYCGAPLGTGPKRDRMSLVHAKQLAKAGVV